MTLEDLLLKILSCAPEKSELELGTLPETEFQKIILAELERSEND